MEAVKMADFCESISAFVLLEQLCSRESLPHNFMVWDFCNQNETEGRERVVELLSPRQDYWHLLVVVGKGKSRPILDLLTNGKLDKQHWTLLEVPSSVQYTESVADHMASLSIMYVILKAAPVRRAFYCISQDGHFKSAKEALGVLEPEYAFLETLALTQFRERLENYFRLDSNRPSENTLQPYLFYGVEPARTSTSGKIFTFIKDAAEVDSYWKLLRHYFAISARPASVTTGFPHRKHDDYRLLIYAEQSEQDWIAILSGLPARFDQFVWRFKLDDDTVAGKFVSRGNGELSERFTLNTDKKSILYV
jgi:hypothetical protein